MNTATALLLRLLALPMLAVLLLAQSARASDAPIVAAASDLQFALADIVQGFAASTGRRVRLVIGSSGNFARQIRQGAPFEIFLSADEAYILDLDRDGFTRDRGALYATGRIVLLAGPGSPLVPDGQFQALKSLLAAGRIRRFAIANPEHAPYGKRAEEALRHAGIWDEIRPRLVLGENVSQAAQFAVTADTEGGIVAYSLALAPKLRDRARFALIPEHWHSPLRQRMVLLKNAGPVAQEFYAYLQEAAARAVLREYGFAFPGESG